MRAMLRRALSDRVRAAPASWSLALLAWLGYTVWAVSGGAGSPARAASGALLGLAARSGAAFAVLRAARRAQDPQERWSWNLLGTALALWAAAAAVRTVAWFGGAEPAIPSVADLLHMSGALAGLAALGWFPAPSPERFGRLRSLLDTVILTLAALTLAWMVVLRPALEVGLAGAVQVLWAGLPAAFDLALAALALRLVLLHSGPRGQAFGRIGLALVVLAAVDALTGYRLVHGDPVHGTLLESALGAAALLMIAAAQRLPAEMPEPPPPGGRPRRLLAERAEPLLAVAMTYAVVGLAALDWRYSGRLDWIAIGIGAALSLLLVARQGAIAGQVEMRQYAAVVRATTDLAFICGPDGRLQFANPALRAALGDGRPLPPFQDLLAGGPPAADLLRQGLKAGWSGEAALLRADGAALPVALSLMPVYDERRGRPMLVGTAHDLTEVKEREQRLQAALADVAAARAALEELNRALEDKVVDRTLELAETVARLARLNEELQQLDRLKSEFVTLVSHELRAPLTNIRTGIELALAGAPGAPAPAADTLRVVERETERLTRFVETILDLSALESGRFPLRPAPLQVGAALREVTARFPEPDVGRLQLEVPDGLPAVQADEQALGSVVFHLLDNARKYAPHGAIHVRARADPPWLRMTVSDSGPGIPPEERERVFERFHRLDARDAREVYGHGLGLHMARRLLEAMGGGIEIEDGPEGGAQAVFWLPLAGASRPAP